MKVIWAFIFGVVFFANSGRSQTGLFSYGFTLDGIKGNSVSTYSNYIYPNDPNYNYKQYDTSDLFFNDSISGSAFSKNILDTYTVSYSWRDNPPPYDYNGYTMTIKFIIDTAKKMLPFFQYENDSYTHSMRSGGSSSSSLFLKNIPYLENTDGSIFLLLTGKDVIPIFDTYSGSGNANDVNGLFQESVSYSSTSNGFDSAKLLFKFLFGKPIASNSVIASKRKKISFSPNPASHSLHIYFTNPLTENNELYIYDMLGRKVKTSHIPAFTQNSEVPISDLSDGTYFVKFDGELDRIIIRKK